MQTTNIQLMQEINSLRQQLSTYSLPTKMRFDEKKPFSMNKSQAINFNGDTLNSVRSVIENSIFSLKTK
jgi:hypothetical protein